jgi:predicted ATPase
METKAFMTNRTENHFCPCCRIVSPQCQLSFLIVLHDLVRANDSIQFIIATHSPILLAYPGAQIFSFDEGKVHQIDYRESQPFQLVSRFIAAPERYINALFSEFPFSQD